MPQRPSRQQASKSFRFDGVLTDQHTAEDGSHYLHLTFNRGKEPGAIIDAEFLLLTGAPVAPKPSAPQSVAKLRSPAATDIAHLG